MKSIERLSGRKSAVLTRVHDRTQSARGLPASACSFKQLPNNLACQHELVRTHQAPARKMAYALLRKWDAHLQADEVTSTINLALCEAALRFTPDKGAQFTTYLFYYLKGLLVQDLQSLSSELNHREESSSEMPWSEAPSEEHSSSGTTSCGTEASALDSPEEATYRAELQKLCTKALASLSSAEQHVLLRSYVEEIPMSEIAESLHYNRTYLFELRNRATERLQVLLRGVYPESRRRVSRECDDGYSRPST